MIELESVNFKSLIDWEPWFLSKTITQTNDGNDLPTGTYFYVVDLAGNDAVYGTQATGWIYLNQEAN